MNIFKILIIYFQKILDKKYKKIILYGHSMGGLVSSIYCKDGKYKDKITKF